MNSIGDRNRNKAVFGVIAVICVVFVGLFLFCLAGGYLLSESMETNISKEWPLVVLLSLATYPALYSKRLREFLKEQGKEHRANYYAGLLLAGLVFWTFFSEGICVRLDFCPKAPRTYETVVLETTMHNGVTRYVTVRDRQGGVHQLRMHDRSPMVGKPVVFSARQGLLGVLYDIEYIH